ncbi:hypothetical protein KA050_03355 [Candidatus Gracilibacteria bacterium]|nr:hypothetical protein [Candidatus Gracilibacteria bacterium]
MTSATATSPAEKAAPEIELIGREHVTITRTAHDAVFIQLGGGKILAHVTEEAANERPSEALQSLIEAVRESAQANLVISIPHRPENFPLTFKLVSRAHRTVVGGGSGDDPLHTDESPYIVKFGVK